MLHETPSAAEHHVAAAKPRATVSPNRNSSLARLAAEREAVRRTTKQFLFDRIQSGKLGDE